MPSNDQGIIVPDGIPPVSGISAANVLDGSTNFTVTGGPTVLITVPAGRTWIGRIGASCVVGEPAAGTVAGNARASFVVNGATATPNGSVLSIEAKAGANAAGGTAGTQGSTSVSERLVIVAGSQPAQLQAFGTIAGAVADVDMWAIGELQ